MHAALAVQRSPVTRKPSARAASSNVVVGGSGMAAAAIVGDHNDACTTAGGRCKSTSQLVRLTRTFSEFRVRSPECTGVCRWESMTPRDHPAEEREAGILAPAIRGAATMRRSYAFQEVAENREEDQPTKRP
jgi:hypothetical protein